MAFPYDSKVAAQEYIQVLLPPIGMFLEKVL